MNKDFEEIENAIYFLSDCIREEKRTSKPLMLHCIRVGLMLLDNNAPTEMVIAGILHDVIEDTKCSAQQLEEIFGTRVAVLVLNCSFKSEREDLLRTSNNTNYQEEWSKEFDTMEQFDDQTLIIKAADIYDNGSLVTQIEDDGQRANLIWKHREFVRRFKSRLSKDQIFQKLEINISKY